MCPCILDPKGSCECINTPEKQTAIKHLSIKDRNLIMFLAKNGHWTPFAHCMISLRIKMPVSVARQWMRSNVGIVYNETSRRYVKDTPEFYEPEEYRTAPTGGAKQGSGGPMTKDQQEAWKRCVRYHQERSLELYTNAINAGMAPEMARDVLPVAYYTEFWATMSLVAAARLFKLRVDHHAQLEVHKYADALSCVIQPLFPVSWQALAS